jgi:DNA-binding beta-propeller fold protein YncE
MRFRFRLRSASLRLGVGLVAGGAALASIWPYARPVAAQGPAPLRLLRRIPLPKVEGRLDHLGVDLARGRLFVAGLGNNTVEVVDVRSNRWIRSIPGFKKPQGIWYVPELDKLFVASGDDGMLRVFGGANFELLQSMHLANGANRLSYDVQAKRLYVGYGGHDAGQDYGLVGVVDVKTVTSVADVKVAAHPAELLLDRSGPRIFVAVYPADIVDVIDRTSRQRIAQWAVPQASHPAVMDLDERTRRLFIAGTSQHLTILDADSGKGVAQLPCVDDADGVFFDRDHQRVYVTGDGFVDAFKEIDANHFVADGRIATGEGAGTSLLVPEMARLFIAVPSTKSHPAEIQVFEVRP